MVEYFVDRHEDFWQKHLSKSKLHKIRNSRTVNILIRHLSAMGGWVTYEECSLDTNPVMAMFDDNLEWSSPLLCINAYVDPIPNMSNLEEYESELVHHDKHKGMVVCCTNR
eukprot:UN10170